MIHFRRAADRGVTRVDWLDSRHSFSFDRYYNPCYMGFRSLRVINDDRVAPGAGFPTHAHRDMEILTYVLEGRLAHQDTTGVGSTLGPGEVQRMCAGAGIAHSEYNHSSVEPVRFLQIWIKPDSKGLEPGYEQRHFPDEEKRGKLAVIASGGGVEGALSIRQDAALLASVLEPGQGVAHTLSPGRHAWVQVARGSVTLNGSPMEEGDGAAVSDVKDLEITARAPAEILLFDLA
ncbi:MAG TPA: pirin family protein [Bryobacteraceae bacterium]|nr:pirin family protein [Bryobacteraceae bacterium]